MAALQPLCDAEAVAPDEPVRADLDGVSYVVFVIEGRYYVMHDHCTHGPGSLAEGTVVGEEVECPFHQGRFHIPSGQPSLAPCIEAVRVWTAHLIDGKICIDPQERKAG